MSSTIKNGTVLRERYLIGEILRESPLYRTYLGEDLVQQSEDTLLREFLGKDPSYTARVGLYFETLRQMQALKHPQIEGIKDFFGTEEKFYLVQNYFEGKTYQDWLRSRPPLTEEEVVELFKQILPALSYMHTQQIAHRNISPSNLLLRSPDKVPVLINFGIISEIMAQMEIETTETRLLKRLRELPINIPSGVDEDLYALAVTVVMLLTGKDIQVLFNAQTQAWDWEKWKLVSDPLPDVLNRMLAFNPRERFRSADEVLQVLNSPHFVTPFVPTPVFSVPSPPSNLPTDQLPEVYSPSPAPPLEPDSTLSPGIKDWQKVVISGIAGSVMGGVLLAGIILALRQNWLHSPEEPIASPSPSLSPSLSSPSQSPQSLSPSPPSPPLPPPQSISQEDARSLIQKWLNYKTKIFGSGHEIYLGKEILTGKAYHDNISRTDGQESSSEWLTNRGAYYTYNAQQIGATEKFVANENQATLDIVITEERTLHNSNGGIDRSASGFDTRLVRYNLQLENGQWKISAYDTIRVLSRRY